MIALNKYYISIALLLILNTPLFSKDSLHTAIQIGGNLSSIYGVNMSGGYIAGNGNFLGYDPSNKLGLNLGYYLSYPINNFSDLNIELWFIQKGSLWGCTALNPTCDSDYTNYYISSLELPIYYSFRLITNENNTKKLDAQLGMYFSYALSRKAETQSYVEGRKAYDINNIIERYNYGLSFSLQWFPINGFFIRIIYDFSLSPIFKNVENLQTSNFDVAKPKMRSMILFIGYEQ